MHSPIAHVQSGFDALNLIHPIQRAVREEKYTLPTPIQTQAIPHLLLGRDLLGCAQTGTGKTAAFALPILQRLMEDRNSPGPKTVRALVLTPTRELAAQISESFRVYGRYLKFNHTVVYGGVNYPQQIRALSRGVDVLVATPGRLLDLFEQRYVRLDKVDTFVLDEGDRMLDMGFLPDIRKIFAATSANRQSMLFSATFPNEIVHLAKDFLNDPVKVSVAPQSTTADRIDQRVFFVERENKTALLESVLEDGNIQRALVFTRTKYGANRIVQKLCKSKIQAEALHGNKSQAARTQALKKFKSGNARVLVATDIASRGLDVDGITHVINFELPSEVESYVHRIGRTARAGAEGIALSFCDAGEGGYLRNIERVTNRVVTVVEDHPFHSAAIAARGRFRKVTAGGNSGEKKSYGKRWTKASPSRAVKKPSSRGSRTFTKTSTPKVEVRRKLRKVR